MRLLRDSHQQFFSPLNKKLLNIKYLPSSESPSLFTQKITTNYPLRKEASTLTNPSSSSKNPISHISHTTQPQPQRPSPQNQFLLFKFKASFTTSKLVNPTSATQCSKKSTFLNTHSLTIALSPPLPTQTPPLTNQCIPTYLSRVPARSTLPPSSLPASKKPL